MIITYDIHEIAPYINWAYFFFAWQVRNEDEKARLRQEAETLLVQWEGRYHAYALFELFEANADGDDIVVRGEKTPQIRRIPCLRQQQGEPPYLCLSDFVSPQHVSLTIPEQSSPTRSLSHLSPLTSEVTFKIRHTPEYHAATLEWKSPQAFIVHSKEKIHGVAPGQFCVVYDANHHRCLGSGEITV